MTTKESISDVTIAVACRVRHPCCANFVSGLCSILQLVPSADLKDSLDFRCVDGCIRCLPASALFVGFAPYRWPYHVVELVILLSRRCCAYSHLP